YLAPLTRSARTRAQSLSPPARNGTHQRSPPYWKVVGLSCRNSWAHASFIPSRSNGNDLTRSPAATALDAAAGGLPGVTSPGCGAVEAPRMNCSFCSSSSQMVTDSTSKVSETNLVDAAHRPA